MSPIYFISITICTSFLIGFACSQQQGTDRIPKQKAILGNSGYFRTETFFPGSSGNAIQQVFVQRPSVRLDPVPVPVSVTIPLAKQPSIVSIPEEPVVDPAVIRSVQNRVRAETLPITTTYRTTHRPISTTEAETPEKLEEQAKSAYYKFGTSVHDTINDHEHVRKEVREGLTVTGMYSYSDGFFRRTVHYIADEDGYRVTKEEIEPVGDGEGPKFNPKGQADVKSSLAGNYAITVDDFKLNKKQQQQIEKHHRL